MTFKKFHELTGLLAKRSSFNCFTGGVEVLVLSIVSCDRLFDPTYTLLHFSNNLLRISRIRSEIFDKCSIKIVRLSGAQFTSIVLRSITSIVNTTSGY